MSKEFMKNMENSNGKKQRLLGIKNKITLAFILFLILPIIIIVAISAGTMNNLGDGVADISGTALESEEFRSMAEIASTKSAYIDEVFSKKGNDINTLAKYAEDLFNGVINVNPVPSYYHTPRSNQLYFINSDIYGTYVSFDASMYFLPSYSTETSEVIHDRDISAHLDVMFKDLKSTSDEYAWIYMGFENEGLFRCYPSSVWPNLQYNPTERGWYIAAVAANTTVYTEPYIDAAGLGLMITIAKPVHYTNGTLIGVVACDLTIQSMQEIILNTEILDTGYAFLIDQTGNTVSHPILTDEDINTPIISSNLEGSGFSSMLSNMQLHQEGNGTYIKNGIEWVINYRTIGTTNYKFAVVVPISEVIAPANAIVSSIQTMIGRQVLILLVVLGAAVVVIGVTSSFVSKRIVNPITNLTKMMNFISQGSVAREIPMESSSAKDEITQLTASFQNLVTMLRLGNSDYYRGNLDLAAKNYIKALDIFKLSDNKKGIGICANNLGNIYRIRGDVHAAEKYYIMAIDIAMELRDQPALPRRYNNLAQLYADTNRRDLADDYFNRGINVSKFQKDNISHAMILRNFGLMKSQIDQPEEAKSMIDQAFQIDSTSGNTLGMAYDEFYMGKLEMKVDVQHATEILHTALDHAINSNDIRLQLNIYKELEQAYTLAHNRNLAHQMRVKWNQIRISLIQKKFVVLVIDVSGSMAGNRIKAAVDGALEIFDNQIHPQDEISIIVFHSVSQVILPPTQKGGNEESIRRLIAGIQATRYQTAFFDAVGDSFNIINQRISNEHCWIIALTDGMDNQSLKFNIIDRKHKGFFKFLNSDHRIGLKEYILDNLMSMNLIIIGIGDELIPIEKDLDQICKSNDQGRYIPVHNLFNTKQAIDTAFIEVSELLAQVNVEEFIEN